MLVGVAVRVGCAVGAADAIAVLAAEAIGVVAAGVVSVVDGGDVAVTLVVAEADAGVAVAVGDDDRSGPATGVKGEFGDAVGLRVAGSTDIVTGDDDGASGPAALAAVGVRVG